MYIFFYRIGGSGIDGWGKGAGWAGCVEIQVAPQDGYITVPTLKYTASPVYDKTGHTLHTILFIPFSRPPITDMDPESPFP